MVRITKDLIKEYAKKYNKRQRRDRPNDAKIEKKIKKWFKNKRYLNKKKFIELGMWKSTRPRKHYDSNDDLTVKEITQFSLTAKSEQAKIKSLFVLNGVSYPVASVILHFVFPDRYPILDFRVMWSLKFFGYKIEQPKSYNFEFWQKYCKKVRGIAKKVGEDIRTVDKALWEYSKQHQKKTLSTSKTQSKLA